MKECSDCEGVDGDDSGRGQVLVAALGCTGRTGRLVAVGGAVLVVTPSVQAGAARSPHVGALGADATTQPHAEPAGRQRFSEWKRSMDVVVRGTATAHARTHRAQPERGVLSQPASRAARRSDERPQPGQPRSPPDTGLRHRGHVLSVLDRRARAHRHRRQRRRVDRLRGRVAVLSLGPPRGRARRPRVTPRVLDPRRPGAEASPRGRRPRGRRPRGRREDSRARTTGETTADPTRPPRAVRPRWAPCWVPPQPPTVHRRHRPGVSRGGLAPNTAAVDAAMPSTDRARTGEDRRQCPKMTCRI